MISNPLISTTLVEGTAIGAYRLLRRIGAGGIGEVWLAEHMALGRRAAIKVLHREFSSRTEIVTRFFNEARAAPQSPTPESSRSSTSASAKMAARTSSWSFSTASPSMRAFNASAR